MKRITKYGNTNKEYRIANANAENIRVTNADERGIRGEDFRKDPSPYFRITDKPPSKFYSIGATNPYTLW